MLCSKFILIFIYLTDVVGWLGSRVVSMLDSGAEGPGFKITAATLSGNSLRQTVHTHCASVHQAAKLVADLWRVARVTAGLAESNGSLLRGLWLTSPAGWLPRTRISSRTLRSAIKYGLPFSPFSIVKACDQVLALLCDHWVKCLLVETIQCIELAPHIICSMVIHSIANFCNHSSSS